MSMEQEVKLFCIPYAGGLAGAYNSWRQYISPGILLYPLELSGRGRRFGEPISTDVSETVRDLLEQVKPEMNGGPFAVLGHSLGAILAYELVEMIHNELQLDPVHVFFSGRSPLHLAVEGSQHLLPDDEFLDYLVSLGGISLELQQHDDLLKMFLPITRSDMQMVKNYRLSVDKITLYNLIFLSCSVRMIRLIISSS
ncbi:MULTISPECIES: thioesterase II family protein [Paenibacillus]|uniref:thioesterase II family protein n=1 Tax=Paenibacillus TaxID=44249 RepID=UPI0009FB6E6E|nr:alpha/beta fold hydrolase [Paenibacillus borealis]